MKKSYVLCCLFAVLFVQNINSQNLGALYNETNAGFSMNIPQGWEMANNNQKYQTAIGPSDGGLTPNIGFGDDKYSGSISEYIDMAISIYKVIYADFEVVDRANFTTNSRLRGMYITFHGRRNEIRVRQKVYVFQNRSRTDVMIITCMAPFGGERYDAIFDACVKTFNWTR